MSPSTYKRLVFLSDHFLVTVHIKCMMQHRWWWWLKYERFKHVGIMGLGFLEVGDEIGGLICALLIAYLRLSI